MDSSIKSLVILYYISKLLNDKKRNLQKNNLKTNISIIDLTLVEKINIYQFYNIFLSNYI